MRCAVFCPIPGRRFSSSINRVTEGAKSGMRETLSQSRVCFRQNGKRLARRTRFGSLIARTTLRELQSCALWWESGEPTLECFQQRIREERRNANENHATAHNHVTFAGSRRSSGSGATGPSAGWRRSRAAGDWAAAANFKHGAHRRRDDSGQIYVLARWKNDDAAGEYDLASACLGKPAGRDAKLCPAPA